MSRGGADATCCLGCTPAVAGGLLQCHATAPFGALLTVPAARYSDPATPAADPDCRHTTPYSSATGPGPSERCQAPNARLATALAGPGGQPLADRGEHRVPGQMPESVVYAFKGVDVGEQHQRRGPGGDPAGPAAPARTPRGTVWPPREQHDHGRIQ